MYEMIDKFIHSFGGTNMYDETINVANKIISDQDLLDIFQEMNEKIKENEIISNQESIKNDNLDMKERHYNLKKFKGTIKCAFDFYDDTKIDVDNYDEIVMIFNKRLLEIKSMWIRYAYSYTIKNGSDFKVISQHINMNIYENKMDIKVSLSSADEKMNDIYQLIKDKILNAPEKYDRIIKKKNYIMTKVGLALGLIPSLIICTLLTFISSIRQLYVESYIIFPLLVLLLGYFIGTFMNNKMDRLYSTLIPNKKYAGYDKTNHKSIYEDDIDKFISTSEIIIGRNFDNLNKRKEIIDMEEKYNKYIPIELIILLIISLIFMIINLFA